MVIAACVIASAVITGHLVAGVITDPARRDLGSWRSELLILAALWVIRAATVWVQARLSQHGAAAVIGHLRTAVLRHVTALPPNEIPAIRADAATVLTSGLDGLRSYVTAYLPALVLAVVLTPASIIVLAAVDLRSAFVVMVALPLIPVFMVLIGVATARRSAAALTAMTDLQARLMDLVAGIPTLRALGRADGPAARIHELAEAHRRTTMSTLRVAFLSALVLELVATLGVALVAVGIGLRLVFGEMTLAAGITALLIAPEVFWPLRRVGAEFHSAQSGKTAADKAFELIGSNPPTPRQDRIVDAAGAVIEIEALSVDGRDGPAPAQLSARIEPGRLTVLRGENGAGKSTTLGAIAGLVRPTSGRVTVAGNDVGELDPHRWWPQLSWLAQRPALVPGTIRANLELFGPVPEPQIACRRSGFDTVLAELPEGLDTVLGRGGSGLSLGERQRLGLARALAAHASVLLLDEPTAHLDEATEALVIDGLRERADAGATVIVVSHRDRVLAAADAVITVRAGADAPV